MNLRDIRKSSESCNVAHVRTSLNENIAVAAPCTSPRIAYDPVIGSIVSAVTDNDNGVIDRVNLTGRIAVDARPSITKSIVNITNDEINLLTH